MTEIFLKAREEVIERQQQEMLELSTAVVKLWQRILALPTIGTLDSARTQIVMETLLHEGNFVYPSSGYKEAYISRCTQLDVRVCHRRRTLL